MTTPGFTEDWFSQESQDALAELVRIASALDGAIVEIGAWEGRSTCAMANAAFPRVVLTCDTWQGSGHEISEKIAKERDIFAQWLANVNAYTRGNVKGYRMGWRQFVPLITEPVALAFIDAEHSRTEVRDNIRALVPKLLPGAVLCGDDAHHGPVKEGVFDVLPKDEVYLSASMWVWQMPIDKAKANAVRLRAAHPTLAPVGAEWDYALDATKAVWQEYVSNVSSLDHAASWQTVAILDHIARTRRPKRVLDLGSGLSSAILRHRCRDAQVVSVDTDGEWLERTEAFLSAHSLSTQGLFLLDDAPVVPGSFDLVFHDIANGDTRNELADVACAALKPGGIIVLDDAQHEPHRLAYEAAAERHGITLYSLASWTFDAIGRYSLIGVKRSLASMYRERCDTPSDIYLHLPKMVDLVRNLGAQHVIELGTRSGVSTVAWLYALESTGGRLTSVDIDEAPPIGWWPHWTFIQGDDLKVVDELEPADIVFIDTSHHYGQTKAELAAYLPLVKPGGVICLHDTELPWPEGAPEGDPLHPVKRAVVEFCDEHGFEWTNDPECWGWAVIKVPTAPVVAAIVEADE